jgi:hypothetical protein
MGVKVVVTMQTSSREPFHYNKAFQHLLKIRVLVKNDTRSAAAMACPERGKTTVQQWDKV